MPTECHSESGVSMEKKTKPTESHSESGVLREENKKGMKHDHEKGVLTARPNKETMEKRQKENELRNEVRRRLEEKATLKKGFEPTPVQHCQVIECIKADCTSYTTKGQEIYEEKLEEIRTDREKWQQMTRQEKETKMASDRKKSKRKSEEEIREENEEKLIQNQKRMHEEYWKGKINEIMAWNREI